MKQFQLLFFFLLILGCAAVAKAEDVVYLKDGSIVHGTITEEAPGVSIKIATEDGNVFVYKMGQIDKITHGDQEEEQPTRHHNFVDDFKTDKDAKFSIFGFYGGVGGFVPGVLGQFNNLLTYDYGATYDDVPVAYSADLGFGWYTNNIAIKLTETFAFNWVDETYEYEVGGYYYDDYVDDFIYFFGSEVEADFSLDNVMTSKKRPNARRVASVYIPVVLGVWYVDIDNTYTGYSWTGTDVDFGSGIGARIMNENHTMWDFQLIYRFDTANAVSNPIYGKVILPNGKDMTADVSGLSLSVNYGWTF